MSATIPDQYYEDFDKHQYDELLFRDGKHLQGRELNNLQKQAKSHIARIASALFKDGDITEGAQIIVDQTTGAVTAQAGKVFLAGAIRDVPEATFTIPTIGVATIGIYLAETVISELEDKSLRNPATGNRGEGQPGAWRLKVTARWGFAGDDGDGKFYPVHTVEDGMPRAKDAPPNLDAFTQMLATYDRQSTGGGSYVVSGLAVLQADDAPDGRQVYTVSEGSARVNGYQITLPTSRRVTHSATPDLRRVDTEVHVGTGPERQRVEVNRYPAGTYTGLRITKEKTVDIIHGAFAGAQDDLPDTSVVEIVQCKQGDTIYEKDTVYKRSGDRVDWSLPGAEPAAGSTYSVTYRYIAQVEPEEPDHSGFFVTGAVLGTGIMVSYTQMLPRYDCLAITQEGQFVWISGVASDKNPRKPNVPISMLPLASVHQTWTEDRRVEGDGVRVVPFSDIESMNKRIDAVVAEVARQRLEADVSTREGGARKGIFVDPLLDDSCRDQGLAQTGAIIDGILTLPIKADAYPLSGDVTKPTSNPYTVGIVLAQPLHTGEMKVNPYMAYDRRPATAAITPAVDQWTENATVWTSAVTQRLSTGRGKRVSTSTGTSTQVAGVTGTALEYLRQINVAFEVSGFGAGEILDSIVFDGLNVTPGSPVTADASGVAKGAFTIPAKVPAGAKSVTFTGQGGSTGSATFVGQGNLQTTTLRSVTTITSSFYDPVAQTFALEENLQLGGIDLWFTAKGEDGVTVQLRETANGYPSRVVLAQKFIPAADVVASGGGHTRVLFDAPVGIVAGVEYAFVVLCDDPVTSIAVAELGEFDAGNQQHVTAQPYTVGVLFSSSNASTWTAHQDKDATFRLLAADFSVQSGEIDLGTASVTNATDIMLLSLAETPSASTRVEYAMTLPGGEELVVSEGQPIRLNVAVSGQVGVKARLKGTAKAGPLLWPGSQLVAGEAAMTADYVTRAVPAVGGAKAVLIYEASIPSGASVTPLLRKDQGEFAAMTPDGSTPSDDGFVEYRFIANGITADAIQVKLTLAGTAANRPTVGNIRVLVV